MQILLVAATKFEIAPLIKTKMPVDVLITGVGVPATLYHLQKRLSIKKYDFVLQAGIAGSFNDSLHLGEAVLVERDCFADIGMLEKGKFTPIFDTGFVKPNQFPFKSGWLINKTASKKQLLKAVKAATVNTITDSTAQKKMLTATYNADIESMEGAAFHYVCLQEKTSFLQVRAISNKVGVRDKKKWQMAAAIERLNKVVVDLLNEKIR